MDVEELGRCSHCSVGCKFRLWLRKLWSASLYGIVPGAHCILTSTEWVTPARARFGSAVQDCGRADCKPGFFLCARRPGRFGSEARGGHPDGCQKCRSLERRSRIRALLRKERLGAAQQCAVMVVSATGAKVRYANHIGSCSQKSTAD